MKYITFKRESNSFDDILKDVKTHKIKFTISFSEHLIVGFHDEQIQSVFTLKYGDDIILFSDIAADRTPVMYRDYTPIKKPRSTIRRIKST